MNSLKLQNNEELENKQEQLQEMLEDIEPHDIASLLTPEQVSMFAEELVALMRSKEIKND